MPTPKPANSQEPNIFSKTSSPKQILLDESFLMCASGHGCDSKPDICQKDAPEDRQFDAVAALLAAYKAKAALVVDQPRPNYPSRVREFYSRYVQNSYKNRAHGQLPVAVKILSKWLTGRNGRISQIKPAKIKSSVMEECNLKVGTLDPLLCQLAIACQGRAPVWTLDSDFWCAQKVHAEIKPTCPAEALASVKQ